MTAFDRFDPFERRISEAIDEIAAARPPAYLDDTLRQTAHTSQRPRWSFPERWLPVETALTRPGLARRVPVRQLLLLVLVGLLVAAAAYVLGSPRRDPVFGPAGNGLLAYTTGNDLYVTDQQAAPRLLATGVGFGPLWSRDGSHVATVRPILIRNREIGTLENGPNYCGIAKPTCVYEIVVTDLNGRSIVAATLSHESWVIDWSPDGRQLLVQTGLDPAVDFSQKVVLVPTDGTPTIPIGSMLSGFNARFAPVSAAPILYLATDEADQVVLRSTDRQGVPLRELAATPSREGAAVAFDVSPDGSEIVFATDTSLLFLRPNGEQVRVLAPLPGVSWIRYSPDGTWLLVNGETLIRTTGSVSEPVASDRDLGGCEWAPDGKVLVCQDSGSAVWLVDLATRTSRATTLSAVVSQWAPWISWQRIAER